MIKAVEGRHVLTQTCPGTLYYLPLLVDEIQTKKAEELQLHGMRENNSSVMEQFITIPKCH